MAQVPLIRQNQAGNAHIDGASPSYLPTSLNKLRKVGIGKRIYKQNFVLSSSSSPCLTCAICMHACMHAHIHLHIHIHTHTCIYIYIYLFICLFTVFICDVFTDMHLICPLLSSPFFETPYFLRNHVRQDSERTPRGLTLRGLGDLVTQWVFNTQAATWTAAASIAAWLDKKLGIRGCVPGCLSVFVYVHPPYRRTCSLQAESKLRSCEPV